MARQATWFTQRSLNPWFPSALAIAACAGLTGLQPARAAAISSTWQDVDSDYNGNFSDTTGHWTNGVPDDSDASTGDTANFSASPTYTVSFTSAKGSKMANVTGGDVTFDLSDGSYALTGTGSTTNGSLVINGGASQAALTVSGGALTTQRIYVGIGGKGKLTLSGPDATLTATVVTVGHYATGDGQFTIEKGATATTTNGYLGNSTNGSSGAALITGGGSTWDLGGSGLQVGYSGSGTLTIEKGGLVKSTTANSIASYASSTTGTGAATVTGSNLTSHSTWKNGGLLVGRNGTGTLTVGDGGIVDSGTGTITLYSLGTLYLQGDSSITAATLNSTGGALNITGTGNTLTGNLTLDSASSTTMLLNSTDDYAHLNVTGTLTAAGALTLNLGGAYTPANNDSFDLFDGTITGAFASISPAPAGFSWNTQHLYDDGTIALQAVPEPAMLSLISLGALGLLSRRRRRIA
jgi:T5SS/PEP-CTERM-associated repeat protein